MKLSIITVSYNTKSLLKQTIDSITMKPDWELIVVDNASTDGSLEMIKTDYPWAKLIVNQTNTGFAKANNQAMKIAQGDYLILLNSDTVVVSDAMEVLIDYLESHSSVGAVTPKIVLPNGKLDPACHRGMPTPWRSFCYYSGLEKVFPKVPFFAGYHQTYLDLTRTHRIETTAATAMMVKRKVIETVGLLDEDFFLYGEDLDWCKRITDEGWEITYVPTATVIHFKSQSGKKHASKEKRVRSASYFYDTMKQFYEKHYQQTYPGWLRWLVYKGVDIKKWLATR